MNKVRRQWIIYEVGMGLFVPCSRDSFSLTIESQRNVGVVSNSAGSEMSLGQEKLSLY